MVDLPLYSQLRVNLNRNVSNFNILVWYTLTHFSPMFHFYTTWKRQKTLVFWRSQVVETWNIGLKLLKWKNGFSVCVLILHQNEKVGNTEIRFDI